MTNETPIVAWEQNAEAWTRWLDKGRDAWRTHLIVPTLSNALGSVRGKDVLDAGCGDGYFSRILAKRGARVTGVDAAKKLIQIARTKERAHPLGIEYRIADISHAGSLGRGRYDIVFACQVLMALPNSATAIRELARLLKPHGRLVIVINHPCFLLPDSGDYYTRRTIWMKFFNEQLVETAYYHRPLEDYVRALARAGLVITNLLAPRATREASRQNEELRITRKAALVLFLVATAPPR